MHWDKRPRLVIVPKCEMDVGRVRAPTMTREVTPALPKKQPRKTNEISLWDLSPSTMLKIKIVCALNINAGHMWVSKYALLFKVEKKKY